MISHRVGYPIPNRLAGTHPAADLRCRDVHLRHPNGLEASDHSGVRPSGPGKHHDASQPWNLFCLVPSGQLRRRIGPNEEHERLAGLPVSKGTQGVNRERWSRPVDFALLQREPWFAGDGHLDHSEPVFGARPVMTDLEGLLARRHESKLIEPKHVHRSLGDEEVAMVDGVERSAEQANGHESA